MPSFHFPSSQCLRHLFCVSSSQFCILLSFLNKTSKKKKKFSIYQFNALVKQTSRPIYVGPVSLLGLILNNPSIHIYFSIYTTNTTTSSKSPRYFDCSSHQLRPSSTPSSFESLTTALHCTFLFLSYFLVFLSRFLAVLFPVFQSTFQYLFYFEDYLRVL